MPDLNIIRAAGRRGYLSRNKHQKNSRNKYSKWISIPKECETFDAADYGNLNKVLGDESWIDDDGSLWGFIEGFEFVGTQKEQFGYFPKPSNLTDDWHGYPIVPFTPHYGISDSLIERWIASNYIDEDDISTLKDRKRL